MKKKYINREISWLSFNHRVLQEAKDPSVPIYEKIKFLAIFSSNLDEFFRVRVASLRNLLHLKNKTQEKLNFEPAKLLKKIHKIVKEHQEEFGHIFKNIIIPELNKNGIYFANENTLSNDQLKFVNDYYEDNLIEHLQPIHIVKNKIKPFLKNNTLYFAIKLKLKDSDKVATKRTKCDYFILEIPTDKFPRFILLPSDNVKTNIIFLDDIIKLNINMLFNNMQIVGMYSIKLTRDADIYIEDEFSGDLLSKIKKGIKKRNTGVPSRFLYDAEMPGEFLRYLKESFELSSDDIVPGGKYHNFNDMFALPIPKNASLSYKQLEPLKHKELEKENIFKIILEKDILINFPFQSYDHVIDFFETAATDPDVCSIKVTQYRVAKRSAVVAALIKAAKNGKKVMVFVEVKARFDEEANFYWAEEMQKSGIDVRFSFPGLKVHSKIALVEKIIDGDRKYLSYCSTGNFNEKTSEVYTDIGLFSSDEKLTNELSEVFKFLEGEEITGNFEHLLVAQFNMRSKFYHLIENEINNAIAGKNAEITLKMNSLEDNKMIKKLYEAADNGVKINMIVRGICCLNPEFQEFGGNLNIISIVDRFLEHSRIFKFHNGGDPLYYAGSADWMKRNLSRRIEVIFPIYSDDLKTELNDILNIILSDNTKARILDSKQSNGYVKSDGLRINSQLSIYDYFNERSF